jgi:DNA recombination protein RmuC
MKEIVFRLGEWPVTMAEALLAGGLLLIIVMVWLALTIMRLGRRRDQAVAAETERAHELDDKLAELNRIQAEMTGRMQTMAEIFGSRQADIAKSLSERLDGLQHRVGQGLESANQRTNDNLTKLAERLAVIDEAQKRLDTLSGHILNLKDVLANKQSRGAFGQARMEAIVSDGLPSQAYAFQPTLSTGKRPDCIVHLPGDPRPLVIDAKFPLEAFSLLKDAQSEEDKRQAAARVRTDVGVHVKDIAEKYVLSGETQDMALLFVPSEAVYADIVEYFDDIVQKAHRARVMLVSPSLLMMAIQVMLTVMRDHRMREEAQVIQGEVGRLMDDVRRLMERVDNLDTHFRQAAKDIDQIKISSEKIGRRSEKIESLEFGEATPAPLLPKAAE